MIARNRIRHARQRAFSLIEVVLALGITTVAIIAIIGLLSVSLQGSREASEDTSSSAILSQVVDGLRAEPFDDVRTSLAGGGRTFTFDQEAAPVAPGDSPAYVCLVEETSTSGTPVSLLAIKITISTAAGEKRTNHATIAKY